MVLSATTQAAPAMTTAMRDCSGAPCVGMSARELNGAQLAIDTGNVRSYLDLDTARRAGLPLQPLTDKAGKPVDGLSQTTLHEVHIAGVNLGDIRFLVADLAKDTSAGHFPAAAGSMAYADIGKRVLRLDYRRHEFSLAESGTGRDCRANCGTLSLPTFGRLGPPVVAATGFTVNGWPLSAQIDTLFTGTLLVYPPAVTRLKLADRQDLPQQFFPLTDGGVQLRVGQVTSEGFGQRLLRRQALVYFATSDVHLPDDYFDATVGTALFAGRVLTLDLGGMRVWVD
jgi:hypothetical protein